jgi:hypothetical protein
MHASTLDDLVDKLLLGAKRDADDHGVVGRMRR